MYGVCYNSTGNNNDKGLNNMKALICERCSGNSIVYENGMYICKNCGTVFVPETAQEKTENLYILARRERDFGDYAAAAKLYGQILTEFPCDWEAMFYVGYAGCLELISSDEVDRCTLKMMKLSKELFTAVNGNTDGTEKKHEALGTIADGFIALAEKGYYRLLSASVSTDRLFIGSGMENCAEAVFFFANTMGLYIKPYEPYGDIRYKAYMASRELYKKAMPFLSDDEKRGVEKCLALLNDSIEKYEREHNV